MTRFDFDTPLDRQDVPFLKTHPMVIGETSAPAFAAGVADMDFAIAPPILEALGTRLQPAIFGYEAVPEGLLPSLQDWLARRHKWHVPTEQMLRAPNALNALAISASLFSEPGDGIIVQPPVFFDFYDVIRENGRTVVSNPLLLRNGRYEMDLAGLETLARDPANRILFLCSPHNPLGRVWSRQELSALSDICLRHDVLVVSDELHADLVFPGRTHTPFAALGPESARNSITLLSPAKTFNIASCCSAFTVVPDDARRAAFQRENSRLTVNKNNAFANVAMEAAFRDGEPWLMALIAYLAGNLDLVRERLAQVPQISMLEPDATFLIWLDFRGLGLATDFLNTFLRQEAGWALTRGQSFGPEGAGFMRLNIACPRQRLTAAFDRLTSAIDRRFG